MYLAAAGAVCVARFFHSSFFPGRIYLKRESFGSHYVQRQLKRLSRTCLLGSLSAALYICTEPENALAFFARLTNGKECRT